jgi:hypothetical protein
VNGSLAQLVRFIPKIFGKHLVPEGLEWDFPLLN